MAVSVMFPIKVSFGKNIGQMQIHCINNHLPYEKNIWVFVLCLAHN